MGGSLVRTAPRLVAKSRLSEHKAKPFATASGPQPRTKPSCAALGMHSVEAAPVFLIELATGSSKRSVRTVASDLRLAVPW